MSAPRRHDVGAPVSKDWGSKSARWRGALAWPPAGRRFPPPPGGGSQRAVGILPTERAGLRAGRRTFRQDAGSTL